MVVLRLATGETVVRGRSRCFSCGHELGAGELVPLFSFLLQGGRCKHCGSKISWQYPVVELASGILFVLVAAKILNLEFGIWNLEGFWLGDFLQILNSKFQLLSLLYSLTLFSLLLAISVYDLRHKIIPNQFVYPFVALSVLGVIFLHVSPTYVNFTEVGLTWVLPGLASGLGAFLFFAALWFFSGGAWMGFGDAKLALGIGFLLGYPLTIVGIVLSFWMGTLVMLPVVFLKGRSLKVEIPFAPFLAAGAFVAWFFSLQLQPLLDMFLLY